MVVQFCSTVVLRDQSMNLLVKFHYYYKGNHRFFSAPRKKQAKLTCFLKQAKLTCFLSTLRVAQVSHVGPELKHVGNETTETKHDFRRRFVSRNRPA
jgi:hypothetical protein